MSSDLRFKKVLLMRVDFSGRRQAIDWANILLVLPYLLLTLVPYFKLRFRFILALPFVALWLFRNIILNKRCFFSHHFLVFSSAFVAFLSLRLTMYSIIDGTLSFYVLFVSNCLSVFPIFMMYYLYRNNCILEIKILAMIVIICMASGAISSMGVDMAEARVLASVAKDYDMEIDRLELMNKSVATYGSVYGMGLIVVAIFYGWKKFAIKTRVFMTFIMLLFGYGIVRAAYSTAVVATIAGMMFASIALVIRCRAKLLRRICFSICFLLVMITAFPQVLGFLSEPIRGLARQIETYEYSMRLESIADAFSGYKDSYAAARSGLYWLSFDTFLQHPIIGKYIYRFLFNESGAFVVHDYIGGHSLFFDTLGQLGLFGFSLLALSAWSYRRYLHDFYVHTYNPEGEISCACAYYALLLASCLNPTITPEIMLAFVFVVPALPLFYRKTYL